MLYIYFCTRHCPAFKNLTSTETGKDHFVDCHNTVKETGSDGLHAFT